MKAAREHHATTVVIIRNSLDLVPVKVGEFDNSLKLDQSYFPFLATVLLERSRSVGPRGLLFPFDLVEASAKLKKVVVVLRAPDVCLYQRRHGGAAHDLNSGARSRYEVKARRRWKTETSLRRYTKIGKVNQLLFELPETMRFCEQARRRRWSARSCQESHRAAAAKQK